MKLSIIIPSKDDEENIVIQQKLLKSLVDDYEVLVQKEEGVLNAVKKGVKSATGKYVLILPADDFGIVFSINKMVELMDEGCDLINPTRYSDGGKVIGGGIVMRFLSILANKIFHILGSKLTDSTFGVKMFKKSIFKSMELKTKSTGWAFALEIAKKAEKMGLNIKEIPVVSINRIYGKSHFKLGFLREYLKLIK